jgi:hypothetical protein
VLAAGLVGAPLLGAGLLMLHGGYRGKLYKPGHAARFLMIDADCCAAAAREAAQEAAARAAHVHSAAEASAAAAGAAAQAAAAAATAAASSAAAAARSEASAAVDAAAHFSAEQLVVAHAKFAELRAEALRLLGEGVRYDFPGGKRGRAVSYSKLQLLSPEVICAFYRDFSQQVGRALGLELVPTQLGDKSSCSLLIYDRPGGEQAACARVWCVL